MFEKIAEAIEMKDYEKLSSLLLEVDLNILGEGQFEGITILYMAIYLGDVEAIKIILNAGAQVNQPNSDGRYPIHNAAALGDLEALKLLFEFGAKLNQKDDEGWQATHWAIQESQLEVLTYLENNGADMGYLDRELKGLLHHAASVGDLKIVRELVENYNFNVNNQDKNGLTPIMWSILYGYIDTAEYLINSGSDFELLDMNKRSLRDYILLSEDPKLLLKL